MRQGRGQDEQGDQRKAARRTTASQRRPVPALVAPTMSWPWTAAVVALAAMPAAHGHADDLDAGQRAAQLDRRGLRMRRSSRILDLDLAWLR